MTSGRDVAGKLARRALAVCRQYLPAGVRMGNYWVVGDARNSPGRSTFIRLFPDSAGRLAGRWTDAATGEYGDLLDIVRYACPAKGFHDALLEAERFLGNLPPQATPRCGSSGPTRFNPAGQVKALLHMSDYLMGTLGERYLINRAIDPIAAIGLRFSPNCYCRPTVQNRQSAWPALIVPVTDDAGALTGVHRQYLDPRGTVDDRMGKAPIDTPKRSLGRIRGMAARFGANTPTIIVAEGVENALSIRTAFPRLTVHAAITAGNLAAYSPPSSTRRLLIAFDDDAAGRWATLTLTDRLRVCGLPVLTLAPQHGDHNATLRALGADAYRAQLRAQFAADEGSDLFDR